MSELTERFFSKVNQNGPIHPTLGTACWEWKTHRNAGGYGMFEALFKGKLYRMLAHRLSYALANGPIPEGMCVCHHCDNPGCVRIDHLFLGTIKDNNQDMYAKGRSNSTAGKSMRKTVCPKCNGPLIPVNLESQGNRRRCPPCTQAAKNAYLKVWKAKRKNPGGT